MGADSSGNDLTFKLNLNDQNTLKRFQGPKPIRGSFNIDPQMLSQSRGEFKVNLSPDQDQSFELPKIKLKTKHKYSHVKHNSALDMRSMS